MTNMKCDNRNKITENNLFNYAVGGLAGWGAYRGTKDVLRTPYSRYYCDEFKKMAASDHKVVADAAKDFYQTSKLRQSGVVIKDLTKENADVFIEDVINRSGLNKKPREKLLYYIFGPNKAEKLKRDMNAVAEGKNACYIPWVRTVAVNNDKRGLSVFHELGHAMNHTQKGVGRVLNRARSYGSLALPFVFAYGLLANKKENPKYGDEKALNFIKENTGAIMFACLLPTLLEEGLASIKGAKIAKPKLSKSLYDKMCKGYARAWGTYAVNALAVGLCGAFAVYIRDKVVDNNKK